MPPDENPDQVDPQDVTRSPILAFLMTDVEGSSRRWETDRDAMSIRTRHLDRVLNRAVESHGGRIFKSLGDGICAVFPRVIDALKSAGEIDDALTTSAWNRIDPLRIRLSIHCGSAEERAGDYLGPTVNRTAHQLERAGPGQLLLSRAAVSLLDDDPPPRWDSARAGLRRVRGDESGAYVAGADMFRRLFLEPEPATQSRFGNRRVGVAATLAIIMAAAIVAIAVVLMIGSSPAGSPGVPLTEPIGSWSQSGYDSAHTGDAISERILSPQNVDRLRKLWKGQTSGEPPIRWSSVTVVGSRVLAASNLGVWAFGLNTGHLLWHNATAGDTSLSAPAVAGRRIYVGNSGGWLESLSLETGRTQWSVQTQPGALTPVALTSPAVSQGAIFVGSVGASVWSFRDYGSHAALLWTANEGSRITSPTVDAGVVYLGSAEGVQALRASEGTGVPAWGSGFDPGGVRFTAPAVASGQLLITATRQISGSKEGVLYALDLSTGRRLWTFIPPEGLGGRLTQPAIGGGFVYVGSNSGQVFRLDEVTGRVSWTFPQPGRPLNPTSFWWRPTIANGVVYAGAVGLPSHSLFPVRVHTAIYALRASTGQLIWDKFMAGGELTSATPLGTASASEPAVSRGRLIFSTSSASGEGTPGILAFGLASSTNS